MQTDALLRDLAACASPETLLAAIFQHHPDLAVPVEVEPIARRVGIATFGDLMREGAASALIVDGDASARAILCAPTLSPQRRRFAIAHQLGHFLLGERHDRHCTARDLGENRRDTPQRKTEMQANRFAAGLLMPKPVFAPFVAGLGKPGIAQLPTIAAVYGVTLEAAASRYLDLSQAMCAFVFVKNGVVRYARGARTFPALAVGPGDAAPSHSAATQAKPAWAPADVRDWITLPREARPPKLTLQAIDKAAGVRLIMLSVNAAAERRADEEAEKFAIERPKFGDGRRG
jgi:Zn-dependent peptidase ImmA (M78 family)